MIYEDRSAPRMPDPRPEDYTRPGCGMDGHAYDAAKIDAEIHNACYSGVYKDEETGQILFSVSAEFIPDAYYFSNGQGTEVRTYKAYFELKEGQTAEEAFEERKKLDEEKNRLKEAVKEFPEEVQENLNKQIRTLRRQSEEVLQQNIIQLYKNVIRYEKNKILREQSRISRGKRANDPMWNAICESARLLVKAQRKKEAGVLVRSYLDQHTRAN